MTRSSYWHDPESPPLSDLELDRVYDIQCDLGALKRCESCRVKKPVETFGAYGMAYDRLFAFYAAGMAKSTDPFEVAAVIHEAITTDQPRLRYPCSWGGPEIIGGRQHVTDEDWVALGAITDEDQYQARFEQLFAVDIRPPAGT